MLSRGFSEERIARAMLSAQGWGEEQIALLFDKGGPQKGPSPGEEAGDAGEEEEPEEADYEPHALDSFKALERIHIGKRSGTIRKIKKLLKILCVIAVVGLAAYGGFSAVEYADISSFRDGIQAGRQKNCIAGIVSGLVGQKLYGAAEIRLTVRKMLYPDARVTGRTTSSSIDIRVDASNVHFAAEIADDTKHLEGKLDKSGGLDWKVRQTSENIYDITRKERHLSEEKKFAGLTITVKDGKIWGVCKRPDPSHDWNISGRYDSKGNVNFGIDGPWSFGIVLKGTVTRKDAPDGESASDGPPPAD